MTFFRAQKILIRLWFIWTGIILVYLFFEIAFLDFKAIPKMIMSWVGVYMGPVFTLMLSSSFFKQAWFEEQLKSKLLFYLALGASLLYLSIISYCLLVLPGRIDSETRTSKSLATLLQEALQGMGHLLLFMQTITTGLLGYFFYSNKK